MLLDSVSQEKLVDIISSVVYEQTLILHRPKKVISINSAYRNISRQYDSATLVRVFLFRHRSYIKTTGCDISFESNAD